jgi:predicted GNAT family acetyltransferase
MTEVTHNAGKSRYEAHVDGALAGFAAYQRTDELVVFTHTEVDPAYEGQGIGSELARFALDDVRRDGTRKVLPLCPFIKEWIGRHRDYVDLVYGAPATTAKD